RVHDGLPQLPDAGQAIRQDRKGVKRFRCNGCKKTFSEIQDRPLGAMRLPMEKALRVRQLLVEGVSIRAQSANHQRRKKTTLALLARVGVWCETFLENLIRNVPVRDVQCDELWAFVQTKEKTKTRKDSQLKNSVTLIASSQYPFPRRLVQQ
ncbi:MAG TPA: hypothetical protein VFM63_14155, partial [Pyrinomonadaceae bacterium]|nr:hypothetical protein [Pyrinomonadaceae bacterium]